MTRISDDAISALKDRNPCDAVALQWVTLRSKPGRRGGYVGPCPICSDDPHSRSASRFECDADKWVCAVCQDGGDVIRLVERREGISFTAAIERLGGARSEEVTPAVAARRGAQDFKSGAMPARNGSGDRPDAFPAGYDADVLRDAYARGWLKARRQADASARYRARERDRLYEFWRQGVHFIGTPAEAYLKKRGVILPANARLKYHVSMIYFADGREVEPLVVHRGPAMLAGIIGPDGKFAGLHMTWFDLARPLGKAMIVHPHTREALQTKKVRGSKAGGFIDLGGCDPASAERMLAGEGIETVASVYTALLRAGRVVAHTSLRAGIDLGNLAGRAVETIAHPTLKTANGRAQRVPGPDPDLASPAMPVPDTIPELVLLGDGDSDPFLTRNALARASRRHAREGRAVRVIFAADGCDFNDMLNRAVPPHEEMQDTDVTD